MLDVAAHQPAIEAHALVQEVALEPVVRDAERELRREDVRDGRGVQQRFGEQRLGRRRRDHGRHAVLGDLVLRDALDHDEEPTATERELGRVLESDQPCAAGLERRIADLDGDARQIAREQIAAAMRARFALALGWVRRGRRVLRLLDGGVEIRLELRLGREQVTERELQLAGPEPLGLRAEQPALEQRVFVREVGQALLERGHLRHHLCALGLEARDRRRHHLGRHRVELLGERRHEIFRTRRDLTAQARSDVTISESAVAILEV